MTTSLCLFFFDQGTHSPLASSFSDHSSCLHFFLLQGEGVAEKIWAQGISLTSISLFFFCTMPLSCPKKGLSKGRVCGQKNRWSEKELTKERVCGQENGLAKEMVGKKKNWWTEEWWTEKRIGGHGIGGHAAATEAAKMRLG